MLLLHIITTDIRDPHQMKDKEFYKPAKVQGWMVVVYEHQEKFTQNDAQNTIKNLLDNFENVGL